MANTFNIILFLLLTITLYSCKSDNCPPDTSRIEPSPQVDSLLKEQQQEIALLQQLKTYKLKLSYTDTVQWKLSSSHYAELISWKRRLEEDSYWKQIDKQELEEHLIIHIIGSVNKKVDRHTTLKRLDDVEEMLISMIGTRYKANIPIFKILKSTVFKQENQVNLELNYLLY